jgi:ArsR family transcriptional regulator
MGCCHRFVIYFYIIGNMEEQQVLKALAALAQASRLQVFRSLVVAGPSGATPGELSDALNLPNATLSFHLKELSNAGLIHQERAGRNLIYRVEFAQMNRVVGYLSENCCEGKAQCIDTADTAFKCEGA